MKDIKELVLATVPNAVVEEKQKLTVTVDPKDLHPLVAALKADTSSRFDLLMQLIGMDWGEKLGVVYLLSSSDDISKEIVLITSTDDRKNPLLYSIADLYETAHLNEREVFAMLGIRFINNPDMRRFILRDDWTGFPLRKDYNADPILNPVNLVSKEMIDIAPSIYETVQGEIKEKLTDIFEKDDYVINIGPQHPSTHGVMHFRTALDGENVKKIDVHSGYIHRGIEKLSEELTYPQILHFTDRLDYLSANISRHGLCMCVEKAGEIEVPERAQYIRTMMDELTRIESHLVAWAAMCNDIGSTTAFIYGFREREVILDIFEKVCGGRLIMNHNVIGGVMFDIYPEFQKDVEAFIVQMRKALIEYHRFFSGNVIALGRMKGIGMMSKEDAISWAVTGPAGRGSGWSCDLRKYAPYALYDKVEFKEIVRDGCDSFARYMNRLDEIEESCHILEQLLPAIPEGNFATKVKPIIKLPEGQFFQRVEGARGEFGVFIESHGDKFPYRIKFRSPSMALVSIMPHICREEKIADLIAIGGSMDYVIPCVDR